MKRFKLTIAYDGAAYYGWQVQPRQVTVQQRVEESIQQLFPSVKRVHSSSRTDTGCLLYTSPSPRDGLLSRMPSSA